MRFSNSFQLLGLLSLALLPVGSRAVAQTPAELDVHLYAALTITGSVGTVYSVEYVTDLAQTNTPSAWRCLEFLQLPASPYLWADKSAPATGKRFYRALAMEAPTNMVFIPPGTFRMGSPTNELDRFEPEGPQTTVVLTKGFYMGKFEVTQREYLGLMSNNPSLFSDNLSRPVEQVSWNDALAYCAALTRLERSAGRIPVNAVFRLPTSAEWEYACRAGTSTRFSYGDDPTYTDFRRYGWYQENSDNTTHPVGQQLPNAWGLYDMHGNVWELCLDWWVDRLPGGIVIDPTGPSAGWIADCCRVVHGGNWVNTARAARAAATVGLGVDMRDRGLGFRVVLTQGEI